MKWVKSMTVLKHMKNKNRNDIYQIIYKKKKVSKQDIAEESGLSLPTVTQNIKKLQDMGLIEEKGTFRSTGGRRAKALRCVSDARVALGADITQNHLTFVLVDLEGKVLQSDIRRKIEFENTNEYCAIFYEILERFLDKNEINRSKIIGIGVSLPAIIASDRKTVTYAKVIPASKDFYARLEEKLQYPLLFFNDANAAGYAEFWRLGSDRTVAYLSLSSSVGGALWHGNTLLYGDNWRGSEFGHMKIVPGGRQCYCGQKGCVDAYCSSKVLTDFTDGNLERFFQELKGNNPGIRRVFEEYLYYLSLTVSNLRMCFDCDVILGGYVGAYLEDCIDEFCEMMSKTSPFESSGDYVKICAFQKAASAVGSALYFINEFIKAI